MAGLASQHALENSQFTKTNKQKYYMIEGEHSQNAVCGFQMFYTFFKNVSNGQSKLWLDKPQKRPHISGTSAVHTSYIQMQLKYI